MLVRPRLVATDLDGTLLRSDGTLSDRTREAIAAAESVGIPTLFVTARPPRWLDSLAEAVGGHGVAICGNGAFVYDVAARTVVASRSHDPSVMSALIDDLRESIPGIVFAAERADGMWREDSYPYAFEHERVRSVNDMTVMTSSVGKLLAKAPDIGADDFFSSVSGVIRARAELGYSGAVGLAEMTAPGVTKASGLAAWCQEHRIEAGDVWACGDMPNDLPMLAWAGNSFGVSNAHPDVIAAVDHVIGSNDEDAVAQLLESLT